MSNKLGRKIKRMYNQIRKNMSETEAIDKIVTLIITAWVGAAIVSEMGGDKKVRATDISFCMEFAYRHQMLLPMIGKKSE